MTACGLKCCFNQQERNNITWMYFNNFLGKDYIHQSQAQERRLLVNSNQSWNRCWPGSGPIFFSSAWVRVRDHLQIIDGFSSGSYISRSFWVQAHIFGPVKTSIWNTWGLWIPRYGGSSWFRVPLEEHMQDVAEIILVLPMSLASPAGRESSQTEGPACPMRCSTASCTALWVSESSDRGVK